MIDLDNTLVDRAAAVEAWVTEFVDEHGLPEGAATRIIDLDADGYSDRRTVFASLRSSFGLPTAVDELLAEYQARIVELTTLVDGGASCLESMRARGWTTVLVSNGSSRQQHAKIDVTGIRELFDAVVVSGDHPFAKPDRRIFEHAADLVGGSLRGSWMIGDSAENDVAGPSQLGMRTAWLDRGRPWTRHDVAPDLTVTSVGEVVGRIASVVEG